MHPLDEIPRACRVVLCLFLEPLPKHDLLPTGPGRFQDVEGPVHLLLGHIQDCGATNELRHAQGQGPHAWLQIDRIGLPHPFLPDVLPRSLPEVVDAFPESVREPGRCLGLALHDPEARAQTPTSIHTVWYSAGGSGATTGQALEAAGGVDAAWAGSALSFPRIQGADVCGRVVALGSECDPSLLGRRVLIDP